MADNWNQHRCPNCGAENWINLGDFSDLTGPDPAPATKCHACKHLWIDPENRESLEGDEVLLADLNVGPLADADDSYANLDEWLRSEDVEFEEGRPTPHYFGKPDTGRQITFGYTNYRGETATRNAVPQELYWGRTEHHPEDQWLLRAHDLDKDAERVFALRDMLRPPTPNSEHPRLIYLASAYSHSPDIAYRKALAVTTELHRRHIHAFSPIVHNHAMSAAGLPRGWDNWKAWDQHMLDLSDELWVVEDPTGNWRKSEGVQAEITRARDAGKVVRYLPFPFDQTSEPRDEPSAQE